MAKTEENSDSVKLYEKKGKMLLIIFELLWLKMIDFSKGLCYNQINKEQRIRREQPCWQKKDSG